MALIRETVETLGPVGAMPAAEHLSGPTFMHEAEAIVSGIQAMASQPSPDLREALARAKATPSSLNDALRTIDMLSDALERLSAEWDEVKKGRDILSDMAAQYERRAEAAEAIVKAARDYFNSYLQDEAAERECCLSDDQHAKAVALRDALGDALTDDQRSEK